MPSARIRTQRLLMVALLILAVPAANATCYLENANSKCEVCWKTVYADAKDKIGVTTMSECADSIVLTWDTVLPEEMVASEAYNVDYTLHIKPGTHNIITQGSNMIPHANIHSCVTSKGACTPFVGNSPGLATHTEALVGSLNTEHKATFTSEVKLTPDQYTIIAHCRFFVKDDANATASKYDVAIGLSRTVLKPEAAVSVDSWINTGIAAALLTIIISCVVWASRSGHLNFDSLIETIYSDEVTVTADILIGIGDTTAFTLGVFLVIGQDYRLAQVLPAAYMFMVIAWVGSIYNAYYDVAQLWDVYLQKHRRAIFFDGVSRKLANTTVNRALRSGKRASISGMIISQDNAASAASQFQEVLAACHKESEKEDSALGYEMAIRDLRRKRGDVLTISTESLPITIVQCYILLKGESVQVMSILIMLFSSFVFGAKLAGLGSYRAVREKKDAMEKRFMEVFNVVIDPTDPEEIKRQRNLQSLQNIPSQRNFQVAPEMTSDRNPGVPNNASALERCVQHRSRPAELKDGQWVKDL